MNALVYVDIDQVIHLEKIKKHEIEKAFIGEKMSKNIDFSDIDQGIH